MKIDDSNRLFQQAVSFVNHTNKTIFLTGKAGTGKTTFLKHIKETSPKKLAIVAPTGVAAINAGGTTIHSFFQLPFGTYLPDNNSGWGDNQQNVYNKNQLLRNQRLRQPQRRLIQSLELLIIDEVSMLRADVLDAIDTLLRSVRRQQQLPFGGVQILFIGDMYQLPPVIKQSEWALMEHTYPGPFFFDAQVMQQVPLFYIELKKIYRQKDAEFINILDNVRNNCCSSRDFEVLHQRYRPGYAAAPEDKFITLTTHNYKADNINNIELGKLKEKPVDIKAIVEKKFPENAYPADETLRLKVGAQVMFIKNDKGETRRYYNGKIGKIKSINLSEKVVTIQCEDDKDEIRLEPEVWKNIQYEYDKDKDKINEVELGSFQQFPIRLAWAVTIHKSQGLTFERAIIDAGQSFAPGQVYVALSRLTNLEGLVLHSPIQPHNIRVDKRVVHFASREMDEQALASVLEESRQEYAQQLLLQAYDFEEFTEEFRAHSASYHQKMIPDRNQAFEWAQNMLVPVYNQQSTAQKFSGYLQNLFRHAEVDYKMIHERNKAATAWFVRDVEVNIIRPLKNHIYEQSLKTRTKKYVTELNDLLKTADKKKQSIEKSLILTDAFSQKTDLQSALNEINTLPDETAADSQGQIENKKAGKKQPTGSSREVSLQLFREGKTITEIAAIRGLVPSTIESHLITYLADDTIDIDYFVDEHKRKIISEIIQINPTSTFSAIKELLGKDYSYTEIKAVMKYEERQYR